MTENNEKSEKQKILVVDDEKEVRRLLCVVLRQKNYQPFEAADASTAMQMIVDMDFDMIISDVNMPGISGIELLQEIKRQQHGIPVLMLTGASRVEDAVECMKNGAVDFMSKPIDFEQFTAVDMRAATVTKAEKHPKADRLLVLEVDLGFETRTILAGVVESYDPADLVDQRVVAVCNLAPRKMRGIESEGMLLATKDEGGKPRFLAPDPGTPNGARVT